MLKSIKRHAVTYPNKLALNNLTYKELLDKIENSPKLKNPQIIQSIEVDAIENILIAWYQNIPCIMVPYDLSTNIRDNLLNIETSIGFSITLFSSGTTANRHHITQSKAMIEANIKNAIQLQNITSVDRIYTISSVSHAAGLHTQTLPGLMAGATIYVEPFNPYKFIYTANQYTITHIAIGQVDVLLKTKTWNDFNRGSLYMVMIGADRVEKRHLKTFVEKDIDCIANYGASEAGPIVISHKFTTIDEIDKILDIGNPYGSKVWADAVKIENGILCFKGDIVYKDDWWISNDLVDVIDGFYYCRGRHQ